MTDRAGLRRKLDVACYEEENAMNGQQQQVIDELVHQGGVHWFMTGALLMPLADHVPDFKMRMVQMLQRMTSSHPDAQSMRDEAIRRIQSL